MPDCDRQSHHTASHPIFHGETWESGCVGAATEEKVEPGQLLGHVIVWAVHFISVPF